MKEKTTFAKLPQEKQQRIYDSAISEFAEHGFESANINKIAKNADVSVGAIYKYFENKEALFLEVVHHCVDKLKTLLDKSIEGESTLLGKVEKIIQAIQIHSRENAELNKIYNVMTTERRSELVWRIVSEMEGITATLYTDLIKEAQEKGEISKEIRPEMSAYFLDNLFILLQFSYSCEYYKARLKMFIGEDAFENDEAIAQQLIVFIKKALI